MAFIRNLSFFFFFFSFQTFFFFSNLVLAKVWVSLASGHF